MITAFLLLIVAFILLVVGAEILVRGASALAARLGFSPFFIGLTVVGFGTSAPELATGIAAALDGTGSICVGNVIGSNIQNIALILGITALISPIPINVGLVRREAVMFVGVAFAPFLALLTGGAFTRGMGVVLLAFLIFYFWRGYNRDRAKEPQTHLPDPIAPAQIARWQSLLSVQLLLIAAGLVLLVFGSKILVGSAVTIARAWGVSELVIGLTIVAVGTSSPELVTSIVAAFRKQSDISMGNILGSNILNILCVLGVTATIQPLEMSRQVLLFDAPFMVLLSLALLPIMYSDHRIDRKEGVALCTVFLAYVVLLFTLVPIWFPPL